MRIEQNESSRFEVLREQVDLFDKQQVVTNMLREKLEASTGEITELRERADRLQNKIIGPANHAATLAQKIVEMQAQAQLDQVDWMRQNAVLQAQSAKLTQERDSLLCVCEEEKKR